MLGQGSFAPAAGQIGTTAIHKDSSSIVAWVSDCLINRGYQQINDSTLGLASQGDSSDVYGKADGITVSLGDGGEAIIQLSQSIFNGPRFDFAVFENGFSSTFLELAFVEVSSNGVDYFRFPSISETQDTLQIGTFGNIDATEINNLAGKYQVNFGTPFDISDLPDTSLLNKYAISHIKIIDVVGNISELYSTKDSSGRIINDPWPTPFASSGFDLDAIGLIHVNGINSIDNNQIRVNFFPNPTTDFLQIKTDYPIQRLELVSVSGQSIFYKSTNFLDLTNLPSGIYFVKMYIQNQLYVKKVVKK